MLYNPRRDACTLDSLIEWLETQNPEGAYTYADSWTCMLAQYFEARAGAPVRVDPWFVYRQGSCICSLPAHFDRIALYQPHTFGAALTRAREIAAQQQETV